MTDSEQSIAPQKRMTVCVESPFKGKDGTQYRRNHRYALAAMMHAISHGATPYLSHVLIPLALDDRDPDQREIGLSCALDMGDFLNQRWFYLDFGWSRGMTLARERAQSIGQEIRTFGLGTDWEEIEAFKPHPTIL